MALFAAVAGIFFFWDPLLTWTSDKLFGGLDIFFMFYPWQKFILDTARQYGELPLWNPYLFSGVPYYANPQPMLFYPFTYLGLLTSITRAMAITLVIHVCLMGVGMYGWLRSLGATHAGAFLAGAAYSFTGTFMLRVGASHYATALQFAWWPLSAWALRTAFARKSWRWALVSGVPLALALLSSHIVTVLLLYVMLGCYTCFEAVLAGRQTGRWSASAQVLGLAALAVAMSVALAAVQYWPLFNFSQASGRAAAPSLDFSTRFSMPIGHWITLFVPEFFGESIRGGYWSIEGYEEITYYVGVLILLTAIAGVRVRSGERRRPAFFLMLALGAVISQMGPNGVLYTLWFRFVPGIAMTRGPGRFGMIYTFAAITAAGLVWSELERIRQDAESTRRLLGLFSRTLVWAVSTVSVAAAVLAYLLYAANKSDETARLWHTGGQLVRFAVLFWAAMALFAAWRRQRLSWQAFNGLAVALVMFDLWSYGLKNVKFETYQDTLWPKAASFMQDKPGYRIAVDDIQFYEHNGALTYHLRNEYGYDPLIPARYQALLNSASNYDDRVYDLLNVKYVIAREALDLPSNGPGLVQSAEIDRVRFYRRPGPLPRAFIVHDAQVISDDEAARAALHAPEFVISRTVTLPSAPPCELATPPASADEAQVTGEGPNHLELTTRSTSAGLLVLSETYYPGWLATVDGQPAQVLRADTVLRAICLPAGTHAVRFQFAPRDLTLGAVVSCVAWLIVAAVAANELMSRRRAQAA